MVEISQYQEAGRRLIESLRLYTDPIAVKYIRDVSEIPDAAKRPSSNGQKWALCQAFTYEYKQQNKDQQK